LLGGKLVKERGVNVAVIAIVVVVIVAVAGIGAYFMLKGLEGRVPPTGGEEEGEGQLLGGGISIY